MYLTIKLEGNMGTIHSVNVDGKEIIPELKYNIAPNEFVHRGHEGFGLREAVDRILNKKESKISENKNLKEERERKKKSKRSLKNIMKNTRKKKRKD